jgi:hypothetical protein
LRTIPLCEGHAFEITRKQFKSVARGTLIDDAWFDISMGFLDVDAILKIAICRLNAQFKFLRGAFQPACEIELFNIVGAVATEDGFAGS